MIKAAKYLVFLILSVCVFIPSDGQLKLPALMGDGMVLQREEDMRIWGWDQAGGKISVVLRDVNYETVTNDSGMWQVLIPALPAGGPYTMIISGSNSITLQNILIGDVWVCSGQSNMELNMRRASPLYGPEIENAENNFIRYFAAPQTFDFNGPHLDYNGGKWQQTNPQTVLNFGAIAYFFARELNQKYNVPIGIINTAIGGTPTEAWISEEAIKAFPKYYSEAQRFKDKSLIDQIERDNFQKTQAWYRELGHKDEGHKNPDRKWSDPDLNTDDWNVMKIPGYWESTSLGPVNGVVWFRKTIEIPASMSGQPAKLLMGRIVDSDSVFINGIFVGTTGYQYPPRRYEIPQGILRQGKNTLVIRVISGGGKGGFVPEKSYELGIGDQKIDLTGDWQFRLGAIMKPMSSQITVKYKPTGLYNAMIAPLTQYRIKGVLWYQGESNAERPIEHNLLFPALVNDWRNKWKQGNLPFLYVQLPNYMEARPDPSESNWALFRESQLKGLTLPNTGMAVAIDVGEWNDIHPLNKLDVARRLSLGAQKVAYGEEKVVYSGPIYQSMQIKGKKIILSFNHSGSGLTARGDNTLNQFSIAGSDKKYVWASAKIRRDKVIVWSKKIPDPVAVRYAWADNPQGANLYNLEGLPASPFRTDSW